MFIKAFCFNSFYENTYIIYDGTGKAWIIDPGCSNVNEQEQITDFIQINKLKLERLLLTHAHIDHILGLNFIHKNFGLKAEMHIAELPIIQAAPQIALLYGIDYKTVEISNIYINDNQLIKHNNESIYCLWTPGHSPGSISYFIKESRSLICGDVLFDGSIGRTDLPGGNYEILLQSIKERIYPLGNDITVYPGHGGITTIGQEKISNPFLRGVF